MYITYAQLLCELAISGDSLVDVTAITLSNLTVDVGGDIFDFVSGSPSVGDAVSQAGYCDEIIEIIGGTQIRLSKTGAENKIANGPAQLVHSDTVPKARGETEIQMATVFIDENTRQWFEPRSKTIRIEGKNSSVMFLRVPIISISEIRLNNATTAHDLNEFEIYTGVDNRRNPRIKIRSGRRDIFSNILGGTFHRSAYSELDGSYGFVEDDGSTPLLIQKATMLFVANNLKNPLGLSSSVSGVGAKKLEKTDLHETQYFQPDDTRGGPSGRISGDIEVDRIIRMYRGPQGIGGTIMDLPRIEDYERDTERDYIW